MQSFQQFKIYGYLVCLPSLNLVVLTNWYQIWLLQILITAYYHLNSTNELSPFFNEYIKQKLTSGDRRARFFLVDDSGVAFSLNFLILSSNCDTMTAISLLYLNIFSTLLKHFTHTPSALECMDITSWIIFRFSSVTFFSIRIISSPEHCPLYLSPLQQTKTHKESIYQSSYTLV